jgi:hypothetical protein
MDVILIILGMMGLGAIVISAFVFMVAARNYVSDEHLAIRGNSKEPAPRSLAARSPTGRRTGRSVTFPLAVNGILISQDRRIIPDRRAAA